MSECGYCGNEAAGFASINDTRYCHPDKGPSCYQAQQSADLVRSIEGRRGKPLSREERMLVKQSVKLEEVLNRKANELDALGLTTRNGVTSAKRTTPFVREVQMGGKNV